MAPEETLPPKTGSDHSRDRESRTGERLESWKEIAAYLDRGVTTVQRWELEEGLPVHRLPHAKRGSVFALREELDSWRTRRAQAVSRSSPVDEAISGMGRIFQL